MELRQLTVYDYELCVLYPHYHPCFAARRLEKFRENTPTGPEVIWAHALNFLPNFKFSTLFFFLGGGGPSLVGVR